MDNKKATLFAAWAAASKEFPEIPHNKTVSVRTKDGGSYTFSYADAAQIFKYMRPVLAKYGLLITQSIEGNECITTVGHENGESMNSSFPFIMGRDMQETGKNATYAARYGASRTFCIATEDDLDANEKENIVQFKPIEPKKPLQNHAPQEVKAGPPISTGGLSEKQVKRLYAIAKSKGWDQMYARAYVLAQTGGSVSELSRQKYDEICAFLEKVQFNDKHKNDYAQFLESRAAVEQLEKKLAPEMPDYMRDNPPIDDEIPF